MAKTRAFKQQSITDTNAEVKDAGILLVAHYKGLTVAEITDLRIKIRDAGFPEAGRDVSKEASGVEDLIIE